MKLTLKQAREALPQEVAECVTNFAKEKRTRQLTFEHSKHVWGDEDSRLVFFKGEQAANVAIGGEFGGIENTSLISKKIAIPVGGYVVEKKLFLGKWFCTVYHNNGQEAINA